MCHRQMDKHTDRWTDEQDWFYRIPSAKIEVWSCLLENWEQNFLKLFGFWAIWPESIQEKGIQLIYFSVQRVQKQWSLANLCKITSYCLDVTDQLMS